MRPLATAAASAAALLLAACAARDLPARAPLYPVAAETRARPQTVTVLLPGALTTAGVFGPARGWAGPDHLVVEYRLPGMQGEPLRPPLDIARSAQWVADLANRHPEARIQLLGYSTGAVIALEAAGRIQHSERVQVVAVASATPFPGAALATLRGAVQVAGGALAIGSLNRQRVWEEYFKTLYLGTGWRRSAEKREIARRLEEAMRGRLTTPGEGRGRAQSASLLLWAPSRAALATQARITFYHGDRDPVFGLGAVRRLAARFDARLCVLPEEGHLVFQSRPDLIRRIQRQFEAPAGTSPC
ncbi:alpha/beta fold hydrolase [Rhodobacter calidifons]|uniref:Alpha/beta hydrolase n=1 Tax=Rhodobacter calidifons TaxID=2715277 RepID=A0ABX0G2Z7_9RHOB|nr:alpha/beta hydrolase [Rhodobacter calidifons]NHB75372.1 alpha/beta hydrolase [Rhodobacter calidifons]